jgi:pyridoxine/pyridoxamine 5'-phosphate oxidase
MDRKREILSYIKEQLLAVVSTVNSRGMPESAVVGFGETDDFELIFGTYNTSRKYKNIQANPRVSFVIGWVNGKTVQYEGVARELEGEEAYKYVELYFRKNPNSLKYKDHPEERYFLVAPKWLRYTDLKQEPWDVVELDF